jgi:hypothetical protein
MQAFAYHSRFIPKGIVKAYKILFREAYILQKWLSYEEYCKRDGKPIVVRLQSSSVVTAFNLLAASMEEWETRYVVVIVNRSSKFNILM